MPSVFLTLFEKKIDPHCTLKKLDHGPKHHEKTTREPVHEKTTPEAIHEKKEEVKETKVTVVLSPEDEIEVSLFFLLFFLSFVFFIIIFSFLRLFFIVVFCLLASSFSFRFWLFFSFLFFFYILLFIYLFVCLFCWFFLINPFEKVVKPTYVEVHEDNMDNQIVPVNVPSSSDSLSIQIKNENFTEEDFGKKKKNKERKKKELRSETWCSKRKGQKKEKK